MSGYRITVTFLYSGVAAIKTWLFTILLTQPAAVWDQSHELVLFHWFVRLWPATVHAITGVGSNTLTITFASLTLHGVSFTANLWSSKPRISPCTEFTENETFSRIRHPTNYLHNYDRNTSSFLHVFQVQKSCCKGVCKSILIWLLV